MNCDRCLTADRLPSKLFEDKDASRSFPYCFSSFSNFKESLPPGRLSSSPTRLAQNSYLETDFGRVFMFQSDLNFKEIWASLLQKGKKSGSKEEQDIEK